MSQGETLSEYESKDLLRRYGIPTARERLAPDVASAAAAAAELGFPVALKLCAPNLAHKTERGLVRLGLRNEEAVAEAAKTLLELRRSDESDARLLVQEMVSGRRELIAGVVRDAQFGPCVMLGLGGIFAEAVEDVTFRVAPLEEADALDMISDLATARLLGEFRGEPAIDRPALARTLVGLGRLAIEHDEIVSVDVNPLIVRGAEPVAVDALVEIRRGA